MSLTTLEKTSFFSAAYLSIMEDRAWKTEYSVTLHFVGSKRHKHMETWCQYVRLLKKKSGILNRPANTTFKCKSKTKPCPKKERWTSVEKTNRKITYDHQHSINVAFPTWPKKFILTWWASRMRWTYRRQKLAPVVALVVNSRSNLIWLAISRMSPLSLQQIFSKLKPTRKDDWNSPSFKWQ